MNRKNKKMMTYHSRNEFSCNLELKNNFTTNTLKLEEKKLSKSKILTNLVEYAGEARTIIINNDILRQYIDSLKQYNINTKNFINKIITINKDLKFKSKKNTQTNNNRTHNINSHKENIISIVKEYYELIKNNNYKLKEKIEKEKEKNKNYTNNLEKEVENLKKTYEESLNINFMLENKTKLKNNLIKALKESNDNFGSIQESKRYRFIDYGAHQGVIDKYFSKQLSLLQKNMLNITHGWNKYKNKVIIFEQEKEELQKILKNPNLINQEIEKNRENSKYENSDYINPEIDLFLLTFDEFEDESKEITLETESLKTNENNEIINNCNNININNNICSKKLLLNLQSINDKNKNKITVKKRDIYYIPPKKDFGKSLLKNSESAKKIKINLSRNVGPTIIKSRTASINNISKLNLKQIVFNKKNKFKKEEEKEMAIKRFEVENEFKENMLYDIILNPKYLKIQMEIKERKKDIKVFKNKIIRKKKIIKEFQEYCKDIYKNYNLYMNNK